MLGEVRLEVARGAGELAADLEVVARGVDVEGVEEAADPAREVLRCDAVLPEAVGGSGDLQVEVGRLGEQVVVQVVDACGVDHVLRQHPVVLADDAVRRAVVDDRRRRIGRAAARRELLVEGIAQERRLAVGEAMVDAEIGHVFGLLERIVAVLRGRERVAGRQRDDGGALDAEELVGAEIVGAVERDWAAGGAAQPILLERRHRGRLGVAGVQCLVAPEVVAGAGIGVATRLRHHVDDGVQGRAVLRVELVAEDLELLHRVLRHVDDRAAPGRIVDGAAVDDGGVPVALIGESAELGHREPAVDAGQRRRPWQQLGQHQEVAVEHRQGRELFADDHRRGLGPRHLDQRALAGDQDVLVQRRDAQRDVDGGIGADQEGHGALVLAEPRQLGDQ